MSYATTAKDLKADALNWAGEPGDGSSTYEPLAYEWLTEVQRIIVSGGTFGPTYLEPADWLWARAWPRGAIQMVQPFNADNSRQATFTTGQQAILLTGANLPDLTGYRILRPDVPARHLVSAIDNTQVVKQIILREPWTGPSDAQFNWLAYPDTYLLPEDFVRGIGPLFLYSFPSNLPTTSTIDVIEAVDLERMYPQTFPWGGNTNATVTGSGLPVLAARVTSDRIRFSHFLNTANGLPMQLEVEYIRRPDILAEGSIPVIPIEHRRMLSFGTAFMILDDKKSSQQESMLQHFLAHYQALRAEHAREFRRMSSRYGVVQPPRSSGNRAIMLTETGLPVYVW